jgi:hypothetical protein
MRSPGAGSAPPPGRLGGGGGSPMRWGMVAGFSMGGGGGDVAVGGAGELPAALVDRPVLGPADQGQVVQVGRATLQPMLEVVAFAPGQGPATSSWGRTPPDWGSWPASRARRASSTRASARRCSPLRGSSALAGRGPGAPGRSAGSGRPLGPAGLAGRPCLPRSWPSTAPAAGGGGVAEAQPVAQPTGRGGGRHAWVGPGGAAAVDGGQVAQPVAFQAVQQPPEPPRALGQGGVGEAVAVLGGEGVDQGSRASRGSGEPPGGWSLHWREQVFGSWRQPVKPAPEGKHQTEIVNNYLRDIGDG